MTDEHPDLTDGDGVRWWWQTTDPDGEGYMCHDLFCVYQRDEIEQKLGPVRPVRSQSKP